MGTSFSSWRSRIIGLLMEMLKAAFAGLGTRTCADYDRFIFFLMLDDN